MKLIVEVTVVDGDIKTAQTAVNGISLATGIQGVDPDMAKEEFLRQSENLLHMIGESQIPALYAAAEEATAAARAKAEAEAAAAAAPEPDTDTGVIADAKAKLRANAARHKAEEPAPDAAPEQPTQEAGQ